jgi:hypothetical protein
MCLGNFLGNCEDRIPNQPELQNQGNEYVTDVT